MMSGVNKARSRKDFPPLFWYMEAGDWEKASERVRSHPREVKSWATIRTKSSSSSTTTTATSHLLPASAGGGEDNGNAKTKRLALHHACFKLRGAASTPPTLKASDDPFVEICRFILLLIRMYPDAAGQRESKHGCLPIHLAAFASSAPRTVAEVEAESENSSNTTDPHQLYDDSQQQPFPILSTFAASAAAGAAAASMSTGPSSSSRPNVVSKRSMSDGTSATNLSDIHAEERYAGMNSNSSSGGHGGDPNVYVSMRHNIIISPKREEMAVQIINTLLDAFPKGIRVDSEGGRLPLHTACAGRATPRVITTLVTAYPSAARHRNKDGFLPLHLVAHWGVSHPSVVITLLRAYPDATVGRNRWERTPLEEALCMAGENGRPHQAAMVRSLRKHPSFWTRPITDLFDESLRIGGNDGSNGKTPKNLVDVDETLPSTEESYDPMAYRFGQQGQEVIVPTSLLQKLSPQSSKNKKQQNTAVIDLALGIPLAELIQNYKWETIAARVKQNPMEAEQELKVMTRGGFASSTGMTPLHYVCERNPPIHVVNALIEAYPLATSIRTMPGGAYPLHIACTWHASIQVIRALVSADQSSVQVKDELGNLPLHSICFSGGHVDIVKILLAADPTACMIRNHQGSKPIDICKRLRHENRLLVLSVFNAATNTTTSGTSMMQQQQLQSNHHEFNQQQSPYSALSWEEQQNPRYDGTSPRAYSLDMFGDQNDPQAEEVAVEVSYEEKDGRDLVWI